MTPFGAPSQYQQQTQPLTDHLSHPSQLNRQTMPVSSTASYQLSDSLLKALSQRPLASNINDGHIMSNLYGSSGEFANAFGDQQQQNIMPQFVKQQQQPSELNPESFAQQNSGSQLDADSLASLLSGASLLRNQQQQHHIHQQAQPLTDHLSHPSQLNRQTMPVSSTASYQLSDSLLKALSQRPLASNINDGHIMSNLYGSSGEFANAFGDQQQQNIMPQFVKQQQQHYQQQQQQPSDLNADNYAQQNSAAQIDADSLASLLSSASLLRNQQQHHHIHHHQPQYYQQHQTQYYQQHQPQQYQNEQQQLEQQPQHNQHQSMLKVSAAAAAAAVGLNPTNFNHLQQVAKQQQHNHHHHNKQQQISQPKISPFQEQKFVSDTSKQSSSSSKPFSYSAVVAKSTGLTNNHNLTNNNSINNNNNNTNNNNIIVSNTSASSIKAKIGQAQNIAELNLQNNNLTSKNQANYNGAVNNNNSIRVGQSVSPVVRHPKAQLSLDTFSSINSPSDQPQVFHQKVNTNLQNTNFQDQAVRQHQQHQQSLTNSSNTTPSHGSATNLLGFMGLYVGNLSPDLTKEQLEKIFSKYGEPVKAHRLIRSPVAFIKYENTESPRAAIEDLHGVLLPHMTLNPDQPLKLHFDRNDTQLRANYRPTELPPKADNGECYGWRTTVCRKGKNCTKKHVSINRGIDFQMWMIKSNPSSSAS